MIPYEKKYLLSVLILLGVFFSFQLHAECILKVRVNNVPPQYMPVDDKWMGKAVELMGVLLDELGCKADYHSMPWQRALWELEKGTIDGMMNVVYSEERAKHFHFVDHGSTETTILFMRKDTDVDIQTLDDLKKLSKGIGYENGNIFDQPFASKFDNDESFRKLFVANPISNLSEMVFRGRLSAELTIIENAQYAIKTNPKYAEYMKIHSFQVSNVPTFFAFSKRSISNDMLMKLNEANLRAIKKGKYDEVRRKWDQ